MGKRDVFSPKTDMLSLHAKRSRENEMGCQEKHVPVDIV